MVESKLRNFPRPFLFTASLIYLSSAHAFLIWDLHQSPHRHQVELVKKVSFSSVCKHLPSLFFFNYVHKFFIFLNLFTNTGNKMFNLKNDSK